MGAFRENKLLILWIVFVISFMAINLAKGETVNPCSVCEEMAPIGYVLKITTLKASDPETLKRWVKDFIDSHKVIKTDSSKFPESVVLYHIENENNDEK